MKMLFLVHLATTLCMAGIIWFVQIVHYPLFNQIGGTSSAVYAAAHARLTTYVVAPLMLTEAVTSILLLRYRPIVFGFELALTNVVLLAIIWLSTAFLQVPQHNRLARGYDQSAYEALVISNWVRTVCWSARSVILFYVAHKMLVVN